MFHLLITESVLSNFSPIVTKNFNKQGSILVKRAETEQ